MAEDHAAAVAIARQGVRDAIASGREDHIAAANANFQNAVSRAQNSRANSFGGVVDNALDTLGTFTRRVTNTSSVATPINKALTGQKQLPGE